MIRQRLVLVLLILGIGGGVPVAWGQAPDSSALEPSAVVNRVSAAFQRGDPERLLAPSADRVEVTLFGARSFYSSAQAFYVLRDFFGSHPPLDFSIEDVTKAGTSCFVQGLYDQDQADRRLRVYLRFDRNDEAAWQLHEVRIESASD